VRPPSRRFSEWRTAAPFVARRHDLGSIGRPGLRYVFWRFATPTITKPKASPANAPPRVDECPARTDGDFGKSCWIQQLELLADLASLEIRGDLLRPVP
jgi:hypothetical protein